MAGKRQIQKRQTDKEKEKGGGQRQRVNRRRDKGNWKGETQVVATDDKVFRTFLHRSVRSTQN